MYIKWLSTLIIVVMKVNLISPVGSRAPIEVHRVERGVGEGDFRASRIGRAVHPLLRRV